MGKAKYDPLLDKVRTRDIPQLSSDPATPKSEEAWVLRSGSASGGGKINAFMGLGFPYISAGSASYTYLFKYRTKEGSTISVALS